MIVLDASVIVDRLLKIQTGGSAGHHEFLYPQRFHAPQLLDIEVLQALRRCVLTRQIDPRRAQQALDDYLTLRIRRYPHKPLLPRVWELRDNLTAYDALYVALAETLGATLITRDGKLASAPGHRAKIMLL